MKTLPKAYTHRVGNDEQDLFQALTIRGHSVARASGISCWFRPAGACADTHAEASTDSSERRFFKLEVQTLKVRATSICSRVRSNIAVQTGDDGVLIVDTGFEQMNAKTLAASKVSDKPIRTIINTTLRTTTPARTDRWSRRVSQPGRTGTGRTSE
jgi:alkyl sulfatase BDS1-like metallo-beta-lactamase superfamily hydrolase